jgi:uncharacterized membrane protein (DUF2068 family)
MKIVSPQASMGTYSRPGERHHSGLIRGTDPGHKRGLRTVAAIEFSKGIAAVGIAAVLFTLRNKDVWDVAMGILNFFHINPDRHFAQVFLDFADQVTDGQLAAFAVLALGYASLRFAEAYGLWRTRVWAEWLAIFSGLIYLPIEIHALMQRSTAFRWGAVVVNLAMVAYVAYVRFSEIYLSRRDRKHPAAGVSGGDQEGVKEWRRSG